MLKAFKHKIATEFNSYKGKTLFVANSAGKDSMALTNLLIQSKIPFTLLHCNFKLRLPDADLDEEFIREFAESHNIPFFSTQFNTEYAASEMKLTIQETARFLRYNWFNSFLQSKNHILLTAHHLDDNVETFFINLLRGTALKGLSAIPENQNQISRPLLSFTQSQIQQYIIDQHISYRQDQSNYSEKYLRNKLRLSILPQLQNHSSEFNLKVQNTIKSVKEADSWIEKQATLFLNNHLVKNGNEYAIQRDILKEQDPVFIEYLLYNYGIHRSNRGEFIKFLSTNSGSKFHTLNFTFLSNRNEIIFYSTSNQTNAESSIIISDLPCTHQFNSATIFFEKLTTSPLQFEAQTHYFDLNLITLPLQIRKWQTGDKIVPFGMNGSKLISDILIDKKVSVISKQKSTVLVDSNNVILSIIPFTSSNLAKITKNTTSILKMSWIN